ncbi:g10652 [Coccomyxa viridis]|uniref:G10652 protein n=1 Tax=Coccomyxa viridis TaxID=1274662 RepID=A0ABP1G5T5_9CHLO
MANAVACTAGQGLVLPASQRLSRARHAAPLNAPTVSSRTPQRRASRQQSHIVRAQRDRDGGGFVTGFVVGGAIFGALGFLFAPQISAALLNDEQRLRLPKFLDEEEKSPEATKQDLADKIASLNSAIDDVSAQLKAQDNSAEMAMSSNATQT